MNVDNRTLFIGDNLPVLRGIDSESVDLIATDPPFNKGVKAFEGIVTAGYDKKGQRVSYEDTWTWKDVQDEWTEAIRQDHPNLHAVIRGANAAGGEDMGAFICWLAVRVLECHRILKPTGSIYLHIDHTAHAYVKAMMDAIFGRANFRNEVVWSYRTSGASKRNFARKHDTILYYAKGKHSVFYPQKEKAYTKSKNRRPGSVNYGGGIAEFFEDATGVYNWVNMRDVWEISYVGSTDAERTGYPTQKPLALYERVLRASSNEGDVVLDPFAGCATTCVAAERLGRAWVGIDINKEAEGVVVDRLQKEAQLPQGIQSWNREVHIKRTPPKRTDDGKEAAPELILVSPKAKGPKITARELRNRLIMRDGQRCQGCGWKPPFEDYLEGDHIMPKSKDGKDSLENRALLCGPCNGVKGNRLSLAELRERRVNEGRMLDKTWDAAWYAQRGKYGTVVMN